MAACLAIGWATTGCGQAQMDHAHTALTADDDGRSATLKVGEAVTVTLPENASTGYRWAIDSADPALITISEPAASYQAGAVGSGGALGLGGAVCSSGGAVGSGGRGSGGAVGSGGALGMGGDGGVEAVAALGR